MFCHPTLMPIPIPDACKGFIVDYDAPCTAEEGRLRARGGEPKPRPKDIISAEESRARQRKNLEFEVEELGWQSSYWGYVIE